MRVRCREDDSRGPRGNRPEECRGPIGDGARQDIRRGGECGRRRAIALRRSDVARAAPQGGRVPVRARKPSGSTQDRGAHCNARPPRLYPAIPAGLADRGA